LPAVIDRSARLFERPSKSILGRAHFWPNWPE